MSIKLWDWDKKWQCVQVNSFVHCFTFFYLFHLNIMNNINSILENYYCRNKNFAYTFLFIRNMGFKQVFLKLFLKL